MNKSEERAKEASIVEVAFKRAYSLGHTCGQVDDGYYADQCWLAFESENKSAIAGATEAQDDWKRVEDGLPEEDRVVQVYDACLYWLNHISQGYVKNGNWIIKYDCPYEAGDYISYYVTHWRNLPSPPSNDKPKDEPVDNGLGLCVECKKRNAVRDYNGHKHYVCEPCYNSLDREFEDEYR